MLTLSSVWQSYLNKEYFVVNTWRQRSWRLKERLCCDPFWQSPQQEGRTVVICSDYKDKIYHVEK